MPADDAGEFRRGAHHVVGAAMETALQRSLPRSSGAVLLTPLKRASPRPGVGRVVLRPGRIAVWRRSRASDGSNEEAAPTTEHARSAPRYSAFIPHSASASDFRCPPVSIPSSRRDPNKPLGAGKWTASSKPPSGFEPLTPSSRVMLPRQRVVAPTRQRSGVIVATSAATSRSSIASDVSRFPDGLDDMDA